MNGLTRRLFITILPSTLYLPMPLPVQACATALPPRPDVRVKVADETAVIVWDAKTQTEHFIRHATFESNTADFGFLVPTPTPPALAEARADAFNRLETLIQPRLELHFRHVLQPTLLLNSCFATLSKTRGNETASSAPQPKSIVRVLDTQRVGRYDATVLSASDAGALTRWLNAHGYATRPAMQEWLTPYVAGRWVITAFKIAKAAPGDA